MTVLSFTERHEFVQNVISAKRVNFLYLYGKSLTFLLYIYSGVIIIKFKMVDNVEKSPGHQAILSMKQVNEIVFKVPHNMPRKRRKQKVLDEDSYIEVTDSFVFARVTCILNFVRRSCMYL